MIYVLDNVGFLWEQIQNTGNQLSPASYCKDELNISAQTDSDWLQRFDNMLYAFIN